MRKAWPWLSWMLAFLIGTAGILRTSPVTPDGKRCPVYSKKDSGMVQCRCAEKTKSAQDAAVTVVAIEWTAETPLVFPWLRAVDQGVSRDGRPLVSRPRDVLIPPPVV
ncbi:MAG: hypothetical protein JST30_01780 [Armatimonadetes bacterium]|nr:hypothetical protein [Armatimonadota bacterium]